MPQTIEEVELHSAYMWDCNKCGTENFNRAVTVKLDQDDEDDKRAIEVLYGDIDEDQLITAQTCPQTVICKQCKESFKAIQNIGAELPDEESDE